MKKLIFIIIVMMMISCVPINQKLESKVALTTSVLNFNNAKEYILDSIDEHRDYTIDINPGVLYFYNNNIMLGFSTNFHRMRNETLDYCVTYTEYQAFTELYYLPPVTNRCSFRPYIVFKLGYEYGSERFVGTGGCLEDMFGERSKENIIPGVGLGVLYQLSTHYMIKAELFGSEAYDTLTAERNNKDVDFDIVFCIIF